MILISRQDPIVGGTDQVVWFLFGVGLVIIGLVGYKVFTKIQEERSKPILILMDHSTGNMFHFGYYEGIVSYNVTIMGGKSKKFWAVQTRTPMGRYFILPTHGDKEDLLVENEQMPFLKLMFAKIIGSGDGGPSVHREWADIALPKGTYKFDEPGEIPPNYILVTPFWSQGLEKTVFTNSVEGTTAVFALLNKLKNDNEARYEIMQDQMQSMLSSQLKNTTNHMLSNWRSVLDAWDVTMMERTVPIRALADLLHLSPKQVTTSAVGHALSQGGIQSLSSAFRSMREMTDDVLDSMGLMSMSKETAEMTFQKVNQIRDKAIILQQDNEGLKKELNGLVNTIQTSKTQNTRQQPETPPIEM